MLLYVGLRVNVSQGASSLETLANDGKYEPSSEILNYKTYLRGFVLGHTEIYHGICFPTFMIFRHANAKCRALSFQES